LNDSVCMQYQAADGMSIVLNVISFTSRGPHLLQLLRDLNGFANFPSCGKFVFIPHSLNWAIFVIQSNTHKLNTSRIPSFQFDRNGTINILNHYILIGS
jgi:hypothetical protein